MRKVIFSLMWLALAGITMAQEGLTGSKGATVAEAKAVLDLSGETLIASIGQPTSRVAFQSFQAEGKPVEIAKTIDEELKQHDLQQLDGATFTDEYCSVSYLKAGYNFTLMVMPAGESNVVAVNLMNQGNVDVSKLPKPAGIKEVFAQPTSAMYFCDLPVDAAKLECRQLLEDDGWEWFGNTSVSFFMRQNAVRLQVMCSSAPAQPGKTAIQFSTELMSSALPMIADSVRVGYSDRTMCLEGDSKLPEEEFVAAYRQALEPKGWKATTQQPLKIDFRKQLIFRNAAKELAELTYQPFESLTRFELKFMTATQVEKENREAENMAAQAKRKLEADQARMENPPKIAIDNPDTATLTESTKQSLEFSVPSGTARSIVAQWIQSQKSTGWTIDTTVDTREIGEFKLTNGDQALHLSFVDPGFIPGEITIRTSREFQLYLNN